MRVITTEKVPIKMWLNDIEEGAIEQAKNLANLPFIYKHLALMPDAHQGYGMPIGGVLATKGVLVPNAVGVDIGCGMSSMKTSLKKEIVSTEQLKSVMSLIRQRIPVGMKHHKKPQNDDWMPSIQNLNEKSNYTFNFNDTAIIRKEYQSALHQVGTLGGGNHFIEIQRDNDGSIWVMIHSGSRNLGKQVADYYNKIACELNAKWFSQVEKSKQLAFLPLDTDEAKMYLHEMNYCVEFAFKNRLLMMETIKSCFNEALNTGVGFEPIINIAHNYARLENHFGDNVLVHRKGATSAKLGEIGIIPSSQGSKSYIVEGLGSVESFMSCSHGVGRKMGRKQAQRELNLEKEKELMDKQGIIHGMRNVADLEEAAGAYKSIDVVMENQKDLVKILVELTPLAVIKG